MKGANPVGAAAVKAEGVDRRVAPAAAAVVSPAAVGAVAGPADLADLVVARAAVAAAVAVPAAQGVVVGAVVRRAPVGRAAVSRV
ncbi:MAG TPA: hypothetical protein VGC48_04965, partial [Gemmatimonadales bacterium]